MIITPAEFEDRINWINTRISDRESKHRAADDLMCKTLSSLGYDVGIKTFYKMEKWYA